MLHPQLLAFQARLDAAGLVAARHADHLCVRLSLLCSVRVRYDGQRLRCEPRFGPTPRTVASAATYGASIAIVAGLALTGAALPLVVVAATLGVSSLGGDALRYLLTEGAITRITILWELERASVSGILPPASIESELERASRANAPPPERHAAH